MAFGKQQLHPKDRQAVLTCLAREESPTPPPSLHPPGPNTRNDRIINKSIRQRTEAVEIQGLGGNNKVEFQGSRSHHSPNQGKCVTAHKAGGGGSWEDSLSSDITMSGLSIVLKCTTQG